MRSFIIYRVIEVLMYVTGGGLLIAGLAMESKSIYVSMSGLAAIVGGLVFRLAVNMAWDINAIKAVIMDKWDYTDQVIDTEAGDSEEIS